MRLALDKSLSEDIVKLAYPVVFGMVFQSMLNIADTIMIGWLPNESESVAGMAAIGITLPLFWAVGGFLSAIAVGTQALTARRFGEKQFSKAGRVLYNSLRVALTAGVVFTIVGTLLLPYFFPFFNSNPDVIAVGVPYAQLRFIGILSMTATFSYKAFFDGIGKTYVHMVVSIIINVANLIINAVLIFGLMGFPAMGVVGAGIGSMIASYLGFILMAVWSFHANYRTRFKIYRRANAHKHVSWEIVRISLPSGLATVIVMTGFLLFLKIVGMIDQAEWLTSFPREAAANIALTLRQNLPSGETAATLAMLSKLLPEIEALAQGMRMPVFTAGTKVIMDIMSLSFIAAFALGTATATLVSQSLGADNPTKAERYGWEAVRMSVYLFGAIGLLEVFFPRMFLNLFTDKQPVIEAAAFSLRMVGAVNFLVGAGLVFMQALFGAGNTKFVMYMEMTLHFTCLVPLAYLFGVYLDMGMEGVFLSAMIYILLLSSILGWKWWQGKWKYIKI